jgi:hypothetical protein
MRLLDESSPSVISMFVYSKTFEQTSVLFPACDVSSGSVKRYNGSSN